MSLVYKRPNSPFWYVVKTRQSTKTSNRKLAEEFARKSLVDLWRVDTLQEIRHTWSSLVTEWLAAKAHKRSITRDAYITSDLTEWLAGRGAGDPLLSELSGELIEGYGAFVKARASSSTANRHLACIRAMLRKAASQNKILRAPTIELYPVRRSEPRGLTIDELNKLLDELPALIRDMAVIAVQTGLRYSNVAGMRWEWITKDGAVVVVPAIATKTNRTYTAPLSMIAKEVIQRRRAEASPSAVFVFSEGGTDVPLARIRTPWERACTRSGITCRFHDLRHTWASWHVQNGTPDRILMHMGGWASPAMLGRYAHLDTKHLEHYADNAVQK